MRLKSLRITRQTYGKNEGLMEGNLEVEDPSGEMKVFLTPDRCDAIIAVVADQLVEQTQVVAANMKANILNGTASVPKLGSPGT